MFNNVMCVNYLEGDIILLCAADSMESKMHEDLFEFVVLNHNVTNPSLCLVCNLIR